MQLAILALLLAAVFALFAAPLQRTLQRWLQTRPIRLWAVPLILTALFAAVSAAVGAPSMALTATVLIYTVLPTLCISLAGPGPAKAPVSLDFAAILLL